MWSSTCNVLLGLWVKKRERERFFFKKNVELSMYYLPDHATTNGSFLRIVCDVVEILYQLLPMRLSRN